jgi:two-component system osmolarity sensor histidine kinase EnvZ
MALSRSISFRLIALLLGAVVLFNLVTAIVFFGPHRERDNVRLPLPAQAAAIVDVVDATPADQRDRLLQALNSDTMAVRLVDDLPRRAVAKGSAPIMTNYFTSYDEAFANRDIHIDLERQGRLRRWFGRGSGDWRPVQLYVRISDGQWVAIQPVRSALLRGVLARSMLVVSLAGGAVIVLLILAVRQTARPIETLAAGARTFADRLDAPDLEVKGPREIQSLATAFNEMKVRIRGLVSERTRVVAAIAHDLRTYLTRLRMRAEFITDDVQRAKAERDIEEMSQLIDNALLFARSSEKGGDAAAVTDVAVELSAFAAARAELKDPVTLGALPAGALKARIDAVAFRRAVANLTDNAVRYGGSARIVVSRTADQVIIDICDNGPGLPETEIDRMMAPFERMEPSRGRQGGGSGLGLAIVKQLVESHGGEFSLFNRPEGGACARVRLLGA